MRADNRTIIKAYGPTVGFCAGPRAHPPRLPQPHACPLQLSRRVRRAALRTRRVRTLACGHRPPALPVLVPGRRICQRSAVVYAGSARALICALMRQGRRPSRPQIWGAFTLVIALAAGAPLSLATLRARVARTRRHAESPPIWQALARRAFCPSHARPEHRQMHAQRTPRTRASRPRARALFTARVHHVCAGRIWIWPAHFTAAIGVTAVAGVVACPGRASTHQGLGSPAARSSLYARPRAS
jgi:hypothetical protein